MTIKNNTPYNDITKWLLVVALALSVGVFIFAEWTIQTLKTEINLALGKKPCHLVRMIEEPIEPIVRTVEVKAKVYAYNSSVNQTDDDPLIMASGKMVYDGAIANNCLEFGTKILVDNKIYIVEDRMNKRYDCNTFDIFMWSYDEAINFGKQYKRVIVYGE